MMHIELLELLAHRFQSSCGDVPGRTGRKRSGNVVEGPWAGFWWSRRPAGAKFRIFLLQTKLLRESGSGSVLLISPLLSLMRKPDSRRRAAWGYAQKPSIPITRKIGILWKEELQRDRIDILLIFPRAPCKTIDFGTTSLLASQVEFRCW